MTDPFDGRALRRARMSAMVALYVLALVIASWAPRIPKVKDDLGLSDGQLGLALLGAPIGAVLNLWLVGLLVGRYGSAAVVRVALVAYCANGPLIPLADGLWPLFAVLALWGLTSGSLDISLNSQIVGIERHYRRPIMTSAHAAWTAGALSGAAIGAAAAAIDVPLGVQLAVLGAAGLATAWPTTAWLLPDTAPVSDSPALNPRALDPPALNPPTLNPLASNPPASNPPVSEPPPVVTPAPTAVTASTVMLPPRLRLIRLIRRFLGVLRVRRFSSARRLVLPGPLLMLGLIAFASFLCEGVAADWSAVYLKDVTGAGAGVAGIGFVAFTVCMFAVRVVGDRATARFGPDRTVRLLAVIAAASVALALALGSTPIGTIGGIVGFGALGVGTACVVPTVFSAAGRIGASAGTSIAGVSTMGYAGWLCGPALIGGLAELVSLHAAMVIVVLLLGMITALASYLRAQPSPGPGGVRP